MHVQRWQAWFNRNWAFMDQAAPRKDERMCQKGGKHGKTPLLFLVWELLFFVWPPPQVILAELYSSGFQRSFSDEDDLTAIADSDVVYAFQAPPLHSHGSSASSYSGNDSILHNPLLEKLLKKQENIVNVRHSWANSI